jgi:hypothetical protein
MPAEGSHNGVEMFRQNHQDMVSWTSTSPIWTVSRSSSRSTFGSTGTICHLGRRGLGDFADQRNRVTEFLQKGFSLIFLAETLLRR